MRVFQPAAFGIAALAAASLAAAQAADPGPPRMREVCAADLQKLCPDVQPGGGRIGQCFKGHVQELSPDCKTALLAHRAAMKAKRAQAMQGSGGTTSDQTHTVAPAAGPAPPN